MPSDRPSVADSLDVNEVKDGLIVYDPGRDRVHYLNATAAVIFTLCDGARDRRAITDVAGSLFGADAPSAAEVDECLAKLEEEGVLQA